MEPSSSATLLKSLLLVSDVRDEGSSDVMEDVGNLRRRPAAAHRSPLTPTKGTPAAIFRAAQTPSEEAHRSPPPATATGGGVEVEESCVQPGNREEHEEVRSEAGLIPLCLNLGSARRP